MKFQHYILQGREIVPVDLMTWARWLESRERFLFQDDVQYGLAWFPFGKSHVSTVFLGLDHSFFEQGPPILFESMIFGGPLEGAQYRCCTLEEAEAQHKRLVEEVKTTPIGFRQKWDRIHYFFAYGLRWKIREIFALIQLGVITVEGYILKIQNRILQFYLDKTK